MVFLRTFLNKLCLLAILLMASQANAASISGRVFHDLNQNGIQDPEDVNIGGVWIQYENEAGQMIDGKYTLANGTFVFSGINAGTYRVKFANPGGLLQTEQNIGNDDAIDSDADFVGFTDFFTLGANDDMDVDAGFKSGSLICTTPVTTTVTNIVCNNNGTPNNPNDDTWTFDLTAGGGTGPWGWDLPNQGIFMFPYGTPRTFGPYPISTTTVSFTINDHDNVDCTAFVSVVAPSCPPPGSSITMNCPSNQTLNTTGGGTTAVATFSTPTASSTCTTGSVNVVQISGPASGSAFPIGTTQVCFRATDGCGNSASCCLSITVNPNTPPVVTMNCQPDMTVNAAAGATSTVVTFSAPTATSTCTTGSVSVTQISGPMSGSAFPLGNTTVCFRATDGCGATATCCFTVNVKPTGVLNLICVNDQTVYTNPNKTVTYTIPTATSNCPVGAVTLTLVSGPASGSVIAPGMHTITYRATDGCDNTKTCSFKITVKDPCDTKIKTANNIVFDLLDIIDEPGNHRTYCMRVTNNSNAPLQYVIFQLPDGIVAEAPATGSVYTAPSGRQYDVRNPNFSHFYSIRFKARGNGIAGGQSDIFKYTLQPQTNPWYIQALARTAPKTFSSVHLTTADCMPNPTPGNFPEMVEIAEDGGEDFAAADRNEAHYLFAAPNPASDFVRLDVTDWAGENLQIQMFDAQGRIVRDLNVVASEDLIEMGLGGIPAGIYQVRVKSESTAPATLPVVVKR